MEKYVSEGASVGDVDNDGKLDVIVGNLWWHGPDFNKLYSYAPVKFHATSGPGLSGYSDNFLTFPDHISKHKWLASSEWVC
ncbi:MAG: FG-GAP repeat protein [Rubritalea sp.]|uniref:FG-GAP repeat protein n=1 Tax=Rubritalea sp. TaxID=2109375 RepID=UPI0032425260